MKKSEYIVIDVVKILEQRKLASMYARKEREKALIDLFLMFVLFIATSFFVMWVIQ